LNKVLYSSPYHHEPTNHSVQYIRETQFNSIFSTAHPTFKFTHCTEEDPVHSTSSVQNVVFEAEACLAWEWNGWMDGRNRAQGYYYYSVLSRPYFRLVPNTTKGSKNFLPHLLHLQLPHLLLEGRRRRSRAFSAFGRSGPGRASGQK